MVRGDPGGTERGGEVRSAHPARSPQRSQTIFEAPSVLSGRNLGTCTSSRRSMEVSLGGPPSPPASALPALICSPLSEVADGTAVDIFSFGMCALEVLTPWSLGPSQLTLPIPPVLSLPHA